MQEAPGDKNNNDNSASQDFEGLDGQHDSHDSPVPPLDKDKQHNQDLDGPLHKDPDALLFQETFEGMCNCFFLLPDMQL
jgi:hypothetical protein